MKSALLFILMMCCLAAPTWAQKANIGFVYPCSVSRGSEVVVELGGQGISGSTAALISGDGIKAEVLPPEPVQNKQKGKKKKGKKKITDEDNLQLADRVKIRLHISDTADLGMRDIKLVAVNGAISNRLYLEVHPYRSFCEQEDNGTLATANELGALPLVINGQVERGGRDCFSFDAKAGQKIVAEVYARRFVPFLADAVPGWFQAVLALYDEEGRELAFSDDYCLNPDPVIRYTIPKDGQYTLQIQDSIFRGREDFVYRIALGELPFVHAVFPLGGQAGSEVDLSFMGDHLKEYQRKQLLGDAQGRLEFREEGRKGGISNPYCFEVSKKKEVVLHDDSGDTRQDASLFNLDEIINARIEHDRDQDWYRFSMKQGEKRLFEIKARRLGSPLDAKIQIEDNQGKVLAECDDFEDANEGMITHHADPQLSFTAAKAGEYYLRVTDTQNKYGRDFGYRLSSSLSQPNFTLRVEPSALSIPQGGTTQFTVFVSREQGFEGVIDLDIKGLPDGFVLSDTMIRKRATSQNITITAPLDVKVGKLSPIIEGRGTNHIKGLTKRKSANLAAPLTRIAEPVESMLQAFYIKHLLPMQEFRMDVTPRQEFRIEVPSADELTQLKANEEVELRVNVQREKGFNKPIQLLIKGLPKTIKSNSPVKLAAGETEGVFILKCEGWTKSSARMRWSITGVVGAGSQRSGKMANKLTGAIMVNSPLFTVLSPADPPNMETKSKKGKKK